MNKLEDQMILNTKLIAVRSRDVFTYLDQLIIIFTKTELFNDT